EAAWVEATGVGHDLDATLEARAEHLFHLREERARVPGIGITLPGLPEDEHGQLGEVVAGEHVDGKLAAEHLARCGVPVAIEAGAVRDADRPHAISANCPGRRPDPGGPANACAIVIHSVATSPVQRSAVSSTWRR